MYCLPGGLPGNRASPIRTRILFMTDTSSPPAHQAMRQANAPHRTGTVRANGLDLAYEQFGRDEDPALLLLMGLGGQLIAWPEAFCRQLADAGLRVIRMDNRDVGLSSKLNALHDYDSPYLAFVKSLVHLQIRTPYSLDDMADDTLGLMDALRISTAHVVGISMGGMIAQLLTARHPERIMTLTSLSSSSGAKRLPSGRLPVLLQLARPVSIDDADAYVAHLSRTMHAISSKRYDRSQAQWEIEARRNWERDPDPGGQRRQLLAVMAAPSRVQLLQDIRQPALVIHGAADPLLPVEHGRDTARHLPNARYVELPDVAHELPLELMPRYAEWILELIRGS